MNIEEFRNYCLSKKGVEEDFPFDDVTLVFKVGGKMFALCSLEKTPVSVNLKCEPEYAIQLRVEYPDIVSPGYHMNKQHWNTVILEDGLPYNMYKSLIDHSYSLVRSSLPKKIQTALNEIAPHD